MLDLKVHSYGCAKGFGSPSGHSSSAWSFPIILFLDIFHGMPIKEKKNNLVNFMFSSWFTYLTVLSLAIFWVFIIPFSRYVLGAHSLNQILFGSLLGIFQGFTMHFIIRDRVLRLTERIINLNQEKVDD
jgi:membrane-associated phospholipid phosphatase